MTKVLCDKPTSQLVDFITLDMKKLGELRPIETGQIRSSKFGVGMETLDREMFDPEVVYPFLKKLGAKMVRLQTGWCRCEKEKGVYDFSWLDEVVEKVCAAGAEVFFSVSYGNQLYMPGVPHESAVGHVPLYYGEAAVQGWLNYVDALGKHFAGRVRHWEIWNEPNIDSFWQPAEPNGADYARLLEITAPVIRSNVAEAVIVGLATCDIAPTFLEDALKAGAADHIDVCGFHPYHPNPEDNLQTAYNSIQYLLEKYAPGKRMEIWQSENGAASDPDTHYMYPLYNINEQSHAKWVARRLLIDLKVGFSRTFYFHALDLVTVTYRQGTGIPLQPLRMGLIRPDGTPKPAFHVYSRLASLFDDNSKRAEMFARFFHPDSQYPQQSGLLASPEGITFLRNGYPIFAYWLTEDPQQAVETKTVKLGIWPNDAPLDEPVLIDSMSGEYFSLKDRVELDKGGFLFELPLTDYPLILTDIRALA